MMVSGPAAGVRAVESVLNALTRRRFTFDRAGAASAVKLGNQVALYAALAGVLEAVALAKSFGVDEDALVEVLRDSTGDSWAARNLEFFTDLVREYDRSSVPGKDRPWRKDLDEFAGIARDRRAPHRFAAELAARFGDDLELFVHNHGGAK
jgi:3-hydroxyisobutyrate dehydrogenase